MCLQQLQTFYPVLLWTFNHNALHNIQYWCHGGLKASDPIYVMALAQAYWWIASSLKRQDPESQDFTSPLLSSRHRSNQCKQSDQPENH